MYWSTIKRSWSVCPCQWRIYRGGTGGFTIFDSKEKIVYCHCQEQSREYKHFSQTVSIQSSDLVSVYSRLIDFKNSNTITHFFYISIFMAYFFSTQKKQVTNQHLLMGNFMMGFSMQKSQLFVLFRIQISIGVWHKWSRDPRLMFTSRLFLSDLCHLVPLHYQTEVH
jgi:hypothetical protein